MSFLKKIQHLLKKDSSDQAPSPKGSKTSLLKNLKSASSSGGQQTRLFFYSNGFQLSAAVISREGQQLKIQGYAHYPEMHEDTLSTVLSDLSAHVSKLPSHAIMLHSRMALGLLDLPISDNNQLTEDKIANIVRWEMETLYAEQAPQWNIGNLLVQIGIISDLERDAIVEIQNQHRHRAASSGGKLPRFGEIVISQGKLDQQTLEKYLALQNQIQQDDTKVQCGWYQSAPEASLFCAAMSNEEHSRWLAIFYQLKLHIDRFYPVNGSLCSLIDPTPGQCLIELHVETIVFSIIEQGAVQSMEIVNTFDVSLNADDILARIQQLATSFSSIILWGDHPRTDTIFKQLSEQLELPLSFLKWPDEKLSCGPEVKNDNFLYPLLGVAQDYFFQNLNNGRIPYVQGMPPPPRFYQQKKWKIISGLLLTLVLMFGTHSYFKDELEQAQKDIDHLKNNYKVLKKTNKKMKKDNAVYSKLELEFNSLKDSFTALQIQKKAVEVNLIERQKFMRELLPILIKSIDKEVVIDSLNEDSWYQFNLTGWALNLAAVSRFERALSRQLGTFNMIISKSPTSLLKTGERAGAYRFNFQLTRKKKII